MNLVNFLASAFLFLAHASGIHGAGEAADVYMANPGVLVYSLDTGEVATAVNIFDFVYSVAYDTVTDVVYWSTYNTIYKANVTNTLYFQVIYYSEEYGNVRGLAVDDKTGDLYGAGQGGVIFMCNGTRSTGNDIPVCAPIMTNDGFSLYGGLALNPDDRLMYYTRNGPTSSEIVRAGMDGSDPTVLLHAGPVVLAGMAIDSTRLYYAGYYPGAIWSCDLDGGNCESIGSISDNPYGLAAFGDRIYWSDPFVGRLASCSKAGGGDRREEYLNGNYIYHLTIVNRTAMN